MTERCFYKETLRQSKLLANSYSLFRHQVSRSQTDDMSVIHMGKLQRSIFLAFHIFHKVEDNFMGK